MNKLTFFLLGLLMMMTSIYIFGQENTIDFKKSDGTKIVTIKETGKVGIGITEPETALHVNGGLSLGDGNSITPVGDYPYSITRVSITDIIKLEGTTSGVGQASITITQLELPSGWTIDNTFVLSLEVYTDNHWYGVANKTTKDAAGNYHTDPTYSLSTSSSKPNCLNIFHNDSAYQNSPFRVILMRVSTEQLSQ